MARTVPGSYPLPDPLRSFVAGTGVIEALGDAGNAPHGLGDIASAVRYLYGYGRTDPVISQSWYEADAPQAIASLSGATEYAHEWLIPWDTGLTTLQATIYYKATAVKSPAFKVEFVEPGYALSVGSGFDDDTRRKVRFTVSGALLDNYAGTECTVRLYVGGDDIEAIPVYGFYLERKPVTDTVPGKAYSDAFVCPDSTAYVADKPLTPDKVRDIRNALATLEAQRQRVYLNYSNAEGSTPETKLYIGALTPYRYTQPQLTVKAKGQTQAGTHLAIMGSRRGASGWNEGGAGDFTAFPYESELEDLSLVGYTSGTLDLDQLNDLLPGESVASIQATNLTDIDYLRSLAVWGL